jgi:hypothetical protein
MVSLFLCLETGNLVRYEVRIHLAIPRSGNCGCCADALLAPGCGRGLIAEEDFEPVDPAESLHRCGAHADVADSHIDFLIERFAACLTGPDNRQKLF